MCARAHLSFPSHSACQHVCTGKYCFRKQRVPVTVHCMYTRRFLVKYPRAWFTTYVTLQHKYFLCMCVPMNTDTHIRG